MSVLERLLEIDTNIFLFLNGLHTSWLDMPMYYISKVWVWIPLYALVVFHIVKKWKKEAIWIILTLVLCVVLTDQLTNLIKYGVERVRPSREPLLEGLVHHVNGYRSGGFSFVSGHASNVFGFAMLSSLILKNRAYSWFIFVWAVIVAYSRIYLGVHYPLDILCGTILGLGIAVILYAILDRFQKHLKSNLRNQLSD